MITTVHLWMIFSIILHKKSFGGEEIKALEYAHALINVIALFPHF